MSRPVPAGDRKSHASTTPTIHRSSLPLPVPDAPATLGPIGASCWTNVWTLGAGVYQPTDAYVIERYCALHERRHRLLVLVRDERPKVGFRLVQRHRRLAAEDRRQFIRCCYH